MNKIKTKEELRAIRKQMFEEMEEKLRAGKSPEDSLFYYHPNELKAYVAVHHHFPDKHKVEFCGLLNWAKYNRMKIKAVTLTEEQKWLFEELAASRTIEYLIIKDLVLMERLRCWM